MTTSGPTVAPWVVQLATGLAVFAVFLDTTVGFVTFPAIGATFRTASPSTLSWVLNAYTLVFAALLIPAGRVADRIGRRRMFLRGVVVFTIGSMACGLAPSVGALIAAEMLEAVGAAMLVPASLALLLQSSPRERVPVAIAIWGATSAVAGAAGPTIGALLVENLSWRWAFFVNLPVGIISFVVGRAVLPEGRELEPGPIPDPWSVVLVGSGLATVTYAIVQTNTWGWLDVRTTACAAAGAAVLAGFVRRSGAVRNPLLQLGLFRDRDFRWANLAALVFAVGFNAMFLGNVLFLLHVWRYSIVRTGIAISVGPAVVAATAPFAGRVAARVGQRRLLVPGGAVFAAGSLLLAVRAGTSPDYVGTYLPAGTLTALGVSLCLPQFSSAAVATLPADQFGAGSAVVQSVRYLGGTFGVALVVALSSGAPAALGSFEHVWAVIVACGLVVSALSLMLRRRVAA